MKLFKQKNNKFDELIINIKRTNLMLTKLNRTSIQKFSVRTEFSVASSILSMNLRSNLKAIFIEFIQKNSKFDLKSDLEAKFYRLDTDGKRDCSLLGDAWMKSIEILGINVKLIPEVESYSFFRRINEQIHRLNYRQISALRKVTTVTYFLHWYTKPNYIPLHDTKIHTFERQWRFFLSTGYQLYMYIYF